MNRFNKSIYKTADQIKQMVKPGVITHLALEAVRNNIREGISTIELDQIAEKVIRDNGATPNFQLVPGYTHTICASVNDDVVHGIPNQRKLQAGDIVSIDCGAMYNGWNGDAAFTFVIPDKSEKPINNDAEKLSSVTELALWHGIAKLSNAKYLNEVGAAIEDSILTSGSYGIIEDYVGHGIGQSMHEDPPVYNYSVRQKGPKVLPGLVVAIEPMVVLGNTETYVKSDDWTVATSDSTIAAHWEHTVAVHSSGIWVLTSPDGGASKLMPFGVEPVPIC